MRPVRAADCRVSRCAGAQARADEKAPDSGGAPGDGKPAATVSATASLGFAHVNSSSGGAGLQKEGRHSRDSNADTRASSKDDSPSGLSARDTARAAVAGGGGHDAPASKGAEDAVRESHTPAPRRLSLMTGTLRMSESESAISERLRSVPETPRSEAELSQLPTSLSAQVGPSSPDAAPAQHMSQLHRARSPASKRSSLSPAGAQPGGWDMNLLLEDGALRHMPRAPLSTRTVLRDLSASACKVLKTFAFFFVRGLLSVSLFLPVRYDSAQLCAPVCV